MANKKKTYLLYSLKPDLQYSEGRSYDVKICVDEIATLPPMLRTGIRLLLMTSLQIFHPLTSCCHSLISL